MLHGPVLEGGGGAVGQLEGQVAGLHVEGVAGEVEVTVEGNEVFPVADDRVTPAREQQHWGRHLRIRRQSPNSASIMDC